MHIPGQKRIVVIDRLGQGEPLEHAPDPGVGLQAIKVGCLDERVKHGAGVRAGLGVAEQPPLSSDHKRADRVFAFVVVCALLRHV